VKKPVKFIAFVDTKTDEPEWRSFDTEADALKYLRDWIDNGEDAASEGYEPEYILVRGVEIPLAVQIITESKIRIAKKKGR
jgi:hypothetical protein